jgi:hypothetical protein
MTFFFQLFFLISEVFQWGCVSELKIPKSEGHLLKPGKLGPLWRKVGFWGFLIFVLNINRGGLDK